MPQGKATVWDPGRGLRGSQPCRHSDLGRPASRTMRKGTSVAQGSSRWCSDTAALANYYSIPPVISQCSDVSCVTKGIWLSGSGHVVPSSLQGSQRCAGDTGRGGETASQSHGTWPGGQESDLGHACRSAPRWPRGAGGDARGGHCAGTYYLSFSLGRGILPR